uniref:Uncharacterized protein n=1 Tax=Xiphophorus couchianus TaxID=32473 RepID=A0A3B5L3G2_9TELE
MDPGYSSEPYPVETVPLQDRSHEASPGQPGDPTGVQHIVVNVPTEPPTDYLVWSLCNFVYGNIFCLGLAALIYSSQKTITYAFFCCSFLCLVIILCHSLLNNFKIDPLFGVIIWSHRSVQLHHSVV